MNDQQLVTIHGEYKNSSSLIPGECLGDSCQPQRIGYGQIATCVNPRTKNSVWYYDPEMKIKGEHYQRTTSAWIMVYPICPTCNQTVR